MSYKGLIFTLHASEAAVQCIVITPVCLFVCGSVTTITRNCVLSSPNWVVDKSSDHLQLIKFWPWQREGGLQRAKIFGSALLQPARSVCVASERFFHWLCLTGQFFHMVTMH